MSEPTGPPAWGAPTTLKVKPNQVFKIDPAAGLFGSRLSSRQAEIAPKQERCGYGSTRASDTNRTYTSEIRFYQHSSLARLVDEAQSEALVESGPLLRVGGLQDADKIRHAFDHRPDVVLGELGRWP